MRMQGQKHDLPKMRKKSPTAVRLRIKRKSELPAGVKEYKEIDREIKRMLRDRDSEFGSGAASRTMIHTRSRSGTDFAKDTKYQVEDYERQPLHEIIEDVRPNLTQHQVSLSDVKQRRIMRFMKHQERLRDEH